MYIKNFCCVYIKGLYFFYICIYDILVRNSYCKISDMLKSVCFVC